MKYQVIVGNVGTVLDTHDGVEACEAYDRYVDLSKEGHGRVDGESVTLMQDDEPIQEYEGTLEAD